MDDACTYGTSSCNVRGFILDSFLIIRMKVQKNVIQMYKCKQRAWFCIYRWYGLRGLNKIDPVASVNDAKLHVPTKDSNNLCYHEHQDN